MTVEQNGHHRGIDGAKMIRTAERQATKTEADGLYFESAANVRQAPQRPLTIAWGQRLPAGTVTLTLGREGTGKTTLAAQMAADVSRGGLGRPPRVVLFFTSEDSKSVIASRLQAAGADMRNVRIFSHTMRGGRRDGFRLPRDREVLVRAVEDLRPALIVVGGSIMSHVAEGKNANLSVDMRSIMEALSDVAERFDLAVSLTVHPNKTRNADPGHAITGSPATIEVARSALLLAQLDDEENTLALAHFKANNSAREPTLVLKREIVRLPNGIDSVRLRRVGVSDKDAVQLLTEAIARTSGQRSVSKHDQAKAIISAVMADGQPREVRYVKSVLAAAGITSTSTIDRARGELSIEKRNDDSVPPIHTWTLATDREKFRRKD